MSSALPPTGSIGELLTVPGDRSVRIIRADPRAWISVSLIRAIQEGRGAACVVLTGDLLSIDGENAFVCYRLEANVRPGIGGGDNARLATRTELRSKMCGDPFTISPPFAGNAARIAELGRLTLGGRLDAGWSCRWCTRELAYNARVRAVVCVQCDYPDRTAA